MYEGLHCAQEQTTWKISLLLVTTLYLALAFSHIEPFIGNVGLQTQDAA